MELGNFSVSGRKAVRAVNVSGKIGAKIIVHKSIRFSGDLFLEINLSEKRDPIESKDLFLFLEIAGNRGDNGIV